MEVRQSVQAKQVCVTCGLAGLPSVVQRGVVGRAAPHTNRSVPHPNTTRPRRLLSLLCPRPPSRVAPLRFRRKEGDTRRERQRHSETERTAPRCSLLPLDAPAGPSCLHAERRHSWPTLNSHTPRHAASLHSCHKAPVEVTWFVESVFTVLLTD
ncbi:hypothetical protein E2C01_067598 [Portunus trituberculatus]|uniref:Uncharacterized protein n=1 Tax=Portunus trituberculatus TaxID=210409 RepID=A0A5B7HU08_PORTR|nr:hypothetical protein [Portunus trituberculatus]